MASINENKLLRKFFGTDPTKKEEMQPSEVLSYSVAGLVGFIRTVEIPSSRSAFSACDPE